MPKVKIQKKISMNSQKLSKNIETLLKKDKEIQALEPDLKVIPNKDGLSGEVQGKRIKGKYAITEEGKDSIINIELDLPLMLSPFKTVVQKRIEDRLNKIS